MLVCRIAGAAGVVAAFCDPPAPALRVDKVIMPELPLLLLLLLVLPVPLLPFCCVAALRFRELDAADEVWAALLADCDDEFAAALPLTPCSLVPFACEATLTSSPSDLRELAPRAGS